MSFPVWPPDPSAPRSVFGVEAEQALVSDAGRCTVGPLGDLPPGTRRIVTVDGRSIGVFNVNGELYAIRNVCPHKGAPLCRGRLRPHIVGDQPGDFVFERDGELIKCPWHQWEFDLHTGWSLYAPRLRVRTYPVTVEDEQIILHLAGSDPD